MAARERNGDDEKTSAEPAVIDGSPKLSSPRSIAIIVSSCLAMLLNITGISTVSVALPTIGRDLSIPSSSLQWIVTSYALTSGCLLLLFGRLADLYGRKLVFICGSVWLVGWTMACGFSRNGIELFVFRAMAGMGPSATVPAAIGILAKTFKHGFPRTVAFATLQAGAPLGSAFGAILGGVVTQYVPVESWRAIFFILAGIGTVILVGTIIVYPKDEPSAEENRRVDWLGAALITGGLVLLTFCLGQGEIAPQGWSTPYIIALLIISILSLLAFVGWEHYVETRLSLPPLMRLDLWTRAKGQFAAIQVIAFLVDGAFSTWSYWATLYYQDYLGLTPIETMLRLLPMSAAGLAVNVVFMFIAAHVTGQVIIIVGCIGTGLANLLFAVIKTDAIFWAFGFPAAVLSVWGCDFIMSGGSVFVAHVAMPHEQSLAGGVFNTVTQIGTAFAMTITTIAYDRTVRDQSANMGITLNENATNAPPTAVLSGYRIAQWTAFAFAMGGLVLSIVCLRGVGILQADEKEEGESEVEQTVEKSIEKGIESERVTVAEIAPEAGFT
ncbi:MFS general substrate transporter [Calocera viscosa TUFC12733]|uniref:MFS general substrate transporter n=1 Tax=Calocera viscosa (strain TUFC12733) TaxID=1330018 RepID=A0A167L4B2_CALVF|nr:MFS general substrate transporter [Calocera viscosa TUFC12733]